MNEVNSPTKKESKISKLFDNRKLAKLNLSLYKTHLQRSKVLSKNKLNLISNRILLNRKLLVEFYNYVDLRAKYEVEMNAVGQWIVENREILLNDTNDVLNNLNRRFLATLSKAKGNSERGLPRVYLLIKQFLDDRASLFSEKDFIEHIMRYQDQTRLDIDELSSLSLFIKYFMVEKVCDYLWYVHQDTRARIDARNYFRLTHNKTLNKNEVENYFSRIKHEGDEYALFYFNHLRLNNFDSPVVSYLLEIGSESINFASARSRELLAYVSGQSIPFIMQNLLVIKDVDWDKVFKNVSLVEKILYRDPVDVYRKMDKISKNVYRNELKKIAKYTKIPEEQLAQTILSLASNGESEVRRHVGYYIIDNGRRDVERAIGKRLKKNPFGKANSNYYLFTVAAVTFVFLVMTFTLGEVSIVDNMALIPFLLIPYYYLARKVVDIIMSDNSAPRRLPRMNLKNDLPEQDATMFAIPCFLTSEKGIKHSLKLLETIYLGNTGENIYLSLLLDYVDGDERVKPGDDHLLALMQNEMARLNKKYGYHDKFSFFLRERIWSHGQERWMGWERKRGKVLEFANILKGRQIYSPFIFSMKKIPRFKYILVVDEDTQVTQGFIADMVGAISHPLNRPYFDDETGKLKRGFVILQPGVDSTYATKNKSVLSKLMCDVKGFNYYSSLSAELYYDLFAEGHFKGKGIMDLDYFVRELTGAFPNDAMLSHDLVEGSVCGTGYASDVTLYEGFPTTVKSFLMRKHRWIRGDWQIADFLGNKVLDQSGNYRPNPLTAFQKFKVLDNMLSSLLVPSMVVLIIMAMIGLTSEKGLIFSVVSLQLFFLEAVLSLYNIVTKAVNTLDFTYLWPNLKSLFKNVFVNKLFNFFLMPYDTFLSLDAIFKALKRRFITHKHALEWQTFTMSEGAKGNDMDWYIDMFFGPWLACLVLLVILIAFFEPQPLSYAVLTIWLLIPLWIKIYDTKLTMNIEPGYKEPFLKKIALRTWNYFDEYTTPNTNYLPPDNVQGVNKKRIAGYTSITNIGFYLTSAFSAYDFRYITLSNFIRRLDLTTHSLMKMERFRGHFYNWYDLKTLAPTKPLFVSTVDSGNFLACIVTLEEALRACMDMYVFDNTMLRGIVDVVHELDEYGEYITGDIRARFDGIKDILSQEITTVTQLQRTLKRVMLEVQGLPRPEIPEDHPFHKLIKKLATMNNDLLIELSLSVPDFNLPFIKNIPDESVRTQLKQLGEVKNLRELVTLLDSIFESIQNENFEHFLQIRDQIYEKRLYINSLFKKRDHLIQVIENWITEMDFSFLYDKNKKLVTIGYRVSSKRKEPYHYQTLASESRLSVFLAIAKSDMPKILWKVLNRKVIPSSKAPFLVSWSGTMFEYFMPAIFMMHYPESIYLQSFDGFLHEQISHAKKLGFPWGISESMYGGVSKAGKYKYKAFGLAKAALNPNVDTRHVVSPYSVCMAMIHDLDASLLNIERIILDGGWGEYGLYEALDYSEDRYAQKEHVIYAYMSHHQGMILNTITNIVSKNLLINLFHNHKLVKSVEYLLDENRSGQPDANQIDLKHVKNIRYTYN